MNHQFDEPANGRNNSRTERHALNAFPKKQLTALAGLGLAMLVGLSVVVSAEDTPTPGPNRTALAGTSDWSIVLPAFTSQFLFNGTDGDIYVRHMPLVGQISLAGGGVAIQGKISADFNAELDATFSGPVWASVTITATHNGSRTVIFEGPASGNTAGLVSNGVIKLEGRGPFQGQSLELQFAEFALDNYNLNGVLIRHPGL